MSSDDGDALGGEIEVYPRLFRYRGFPPYSLDSDGLSILLREASHADELPDLHFLDYMLESDDITRVDKIDALEMAGAVLLGKDENHAKFTLAYHYWRRALTLRLMDTGECRPIHKTPLKSKSGQLSEWSTLEDLQHIEQQPAQRKIQSLLVRLRIFSGLCWRAVYRHFLSAINGFLSNGQVPHKASTSEILDVSWITLDTILRLDRPHERDLRLVVLDFVGRVIHFSKQNDSKFVSENLKQFTDLVLMSDLSYSTDPALEAPVTESGHLINLCLMMIIISRHPEMVTEEMRLSLLQLVHRDARDENGSSLLLIVTCFIPDSEALSTIRFLLQLGADVNGRDIFGDGVLHILSTRPASEIRDAAARLFVEHGAHLDMVNKEGMTAADLWFLKNTPEKKDVADLPDWLQEGVPKLMCLSSRVIRRHKLPYDDGAIVAPALVPFVSLH